MKTRAARRLYHICIAAAVLVFAAAMIGILHEVPAGQRKEGVKGAALALTVIAIGLTALYRIGRAMDREEREEEAREAGKELNESQT